MSSHHYEDVVGVTFRDKCVTQFDLSVDEIANYVKEKKTIMSATLLARYLYLGRRRRKPSFFQRVVTSLRFSWQTA